MNSGPERVFPLIRLSAGDYLLVGNDRRKLWRICRYDDPLVTGDGTTRCVSRWGVWQWTERTDGQDMVNSLDARDWNQWEFWDGSFASRREAVKHALRAEG